MDKTMVRSVFAVIFAVPNPALDMLWGINILEAQCVIPLNALYEHVFLFLGSWLALLSVVVSLHVVLSTFQALLPGLQAYLLAREVSFD